MHNYLPDVERALLDIFIAADGTELRDEDRRKAREVAALLAEIEQAAARFSNRHPLNLVDAASGKSYVGLLAAKLILAHRNSPSSVTTIERDPGRVASSLKAAERLRLNIPISCLQSTVESTEAWPSEPSIVTALHACGDAADTIIDRALAARARMILLVPCCTGRSVRAAGLAERLAAALPVPRNAPVRRRFIQSVVDTERTWRLEAAGYETEVVEFVPPTVTDHNLLWRARRVGEPVRMAAARASWEKLFEPYA